MLGFFFLYKIIYLHLNYIVLLYICDYIVDLDFFYCFLIDSICLGVDKELPGEGGAGGRGVGILRKSRSKP